MNTDITIVLDRSGSMSSIRDDTIGGFNSFVEDQKKVPGEATLSLVQFDHEYEVVFEGTKLSEVNQLSQITYVPRGSTALLDAVGRTINRTGERLSKMKEEDRPSQVLFVIITDGYENASQEFRMNNISDMISHQEKNYNWKFVFLGANQDAIATASQMSIQPGAAMTYNATPEGTKALYNSVSANVRSFRSGNKWQFNDEDRKKQKY